jgi:hypothetical protein
METLRRASSVMKAWIVNHHPVLLPPPQVVPLHLGSILLFQLNQHQRTQKSLHAKRDRMVAAAAAAGKSYKTIMQTTLNGRMSFRLIFKVKRMNQVEKVRKL